MSTVSRSYHTKLISPSWPPSSLRQQSEAPFGRALVPSRLRFVPGVFLQSLPDGGESLGMNEKQKSECLTDRLGLIDSSPEAWRKLTAFISTFNASAQRDGTRKALKLFWWVRHGQGHHNKVIDEHAQDGKWVDILTEDPGDEKLPHAPDADLTEHGKDQAKSLRERLLVQTSKGMPAPEKCYSSLMRRSVCTADILHKGWGLDKTIYAVEVFREQNGKFFCHKRCDIVDGKLSIELENHDVKVEEGIPVKDTMFSKTERESQEHLDLRVGSGLSDICARDPETYISITSHLGVTHSLLRHVGHPEWPMETADVVPVLVEITGIPVTGDRPEMIRWKGEDEWQVTFNKTCTSASEQELETSFESFAPIMCA